MHQRKAPESRHNAESKHLESFSGYQWHVLPGETEQVTCQNEYTDASTATRQHVAHNADFEFSSTQRKAQGVFLVIDKSI